LEKQYPNKRSKWRIIAAMISKKFVSKGIAYNCGNQYEKFTEQQLEAGSGLQNDTLDQAAADLASPISQSKL
jgi:hypothetical protein